jgi:light-independent protochlorophyllide reductase subunit B
VVAAPAAIAAPTALVPTPSLSTNGVKAIAQPAQAASNQATWSPEAEKELGKIPFFVRGKARRNTERFAQDLGVATITVETLYDAKAHFSR